MACLLVMDDDIPVVVRMRAEWLNEDFSRFVTGCTQGLALLPLRDRSHALPSGFGSIFSRVEPKRKPALVASNRGRCSAELRAAARPDPQRQDP